MTVIDSVNCRGLIVHNNNLLVVKLAQDTINYYCLPGGKVERRETLEECIFREITEELGIKPLVGPLCCINQGLLKKYDKQTLEFYFLITNGEDFLSLQESGTGTHSHEIAEILWTDITKDDITLLPDFIKPMLRGLDFSNLETIIPRIYSST